MSATGYRVTFERLRPGNGGRAVCETMGAKCQHASVARQQAAKKNGFLRVLVIEPLSAVQYEKEFPAGQCGRAGRYVSLRA